MIGVDFTGRLGNQLFTYAFARYLLERRHNDGECLVANFKRTMNGEAEEGFGDSLCHFNVMPYKRTTEDLILNHGSLTQRIIYLLYSAWRQLPGFGDRSIAAVEQRLAHFGIFFNGTTRKTRCPNTLYNKNLFVRGFFQDHSFLHTLRPILTNEFTPLLPPLAENRLLYEAASRHNSVCVSVRRGDYLSDTYKKDFYVCTPAYFQKAFSLICERVEHPVFIFFSDDIEWVRSNIPPPKGTECYYESGHDPVWETLRLMYSCHHFIISNSTFAWWAQYLGRRDNKLVISPSRWFANPHWQSYLLDDNFIKVE